MFLPRSVSLFFPQTQPHSPPFSPVPAIIPLSLPPTTIAHVKFSRLTSTHHIDSNLLIRNPYYSATIPIWHDKLPLSLPELERWEEEWSKEEAGEVVRAVGAWVLVFRKAVNEIRGDGEVVCKNSLSCLCGQEQEQEGRWDKGKTQIRPGLSVLSILSFPSRSLIIPSETNEPPKPSLILSHRPCRTSAFSSLLFQDFSNETQLHTPSLLNLFSSLSASISQYLHALRSRLRSGRICAESVGAGSGLMGKLVEMRGMGGEVSSVVCKHALFLSLGSLRGQLWEIQYT